MARWKDGAVNRTCEKSECRAHADHITCISACGPLIATGMSHVVYCA